MRGIRRGREEEGEVEGGSSGGWWRNVVGTRAKNKQTCLVLGGKQMNDW